MQTSFWWWQCSDRYIIISLSPTSRTHFPPPPFSPSLISLMVSVDVKHHVYLHCLVTLSSTINITHHVYLLTNSNLLPAIPTIVSNEVPPCYTISSPANRSIMSQAVAKLLHLCLYASVRHVVFGRPPLLFPSAVQRMAALVMESSSFWSTWSIHLQWSSCDQGAHVFLVACFGRGILCWFFLVRND